jgi:hypothetical protein
MGGVVGIGGPIDPDGGIEYCYFSRVNFGISMIRLAK